LLAGTPLNVSGVTGHNLRDGHVVQVMDACGERGQRVAGFERATSDGGVYDFQRPRAQGGVFALCWCAGLGPDGAPSATVCDARSDFAYELGRLVVTGPDGASSFDCIRGQRCELHGVSGVRLDGDEPQHVALARSCEGGTGSLILSTSGMPAALLPADGAWASTLDFADGLLKVRPGTYVVCWCRGDCPLADFFTLVGDLRLSGPERAAQGAERNFRQVLEHGPGPFESTPSGPFE
jgi:hypothetical protein